jgi:1-acyl-sn-glycerol-3-phosphate acyltransferase
MFVVMPFIIVFSFFGQIRGGNLIYKVCNIWGVIWYALIGMWHKNIYEAPHDASREYVFVANHISYMDIPPLVMTFKQPIRVLGKYEMVKVPVFGFIYRCAVVLVDRKNPERRAKSVRQLKAALRKKVSIFIFPEGTFNETGQPLKDFYDGAFRLAIEMQTPIKPVLFIDTIDRLHYRGLLEVTPGPNRVVFLEEVSIEGLTMFDVPKLRQKVYNIMDAGLRRYRKYEPAVIKEK